ncbi:hypothetical protein NX801_07115 [Streptomyces sp. LP05-1]|uniref:Right handed beta helix domain-containing protein n=1 Tax=Streptomyces pyxinae TaxID=2970734 RepID=A0ABT2CE94_9ACTN|nr:hypothetical protein [Streptomyces sp. LP05-1]MCS0635432.1 hypothetical protein [Streptomyces sp. LP05-1]
MRRTGLVAMVAGLLVGGLVAPAASAPVRTAAGSGRGAAAPAVDATVHVSPDGRNEGDGTKSAPVADIAGVERVVAKRGATGAVTVLFRGGTYRLPQQQLHPTGARSIDFAAEPGTGRPVFDGGRTAEYWLKVMPTETRLSFTGFTVLRYTIGGIMLRGTGTGPGKRITGATIRGNVFKEIGGPASGFGAVHLNYADHTLIQNNAFLDLVNGECGGCMHGVYLALESNDNRVTGTTTFARVSGDPVRVTDFSNRNTVSGATFDHTGTHAALSVWRLPDRPRQCSSGNVLYSDESAITGFTGEPLPAVAEGSKPEEGPCPDAVRLEPAG